MNQNFNPQVTLTCQISQHWQKKIARIADDRNKSSEEIIAEAIALYLGVTNVEPSDRLLALEGEVAVLKQMLSQFNTTLTFLKQQQAIANTNSSSSANTTSAVSFPQPFLDNAVEDDIDDDFDDEPDEILTDFLEPN
ncbi:MAG: hypothetical protein AAGA60_00570 [Cyanobacteria bacterium P01_E01_bin.42]